MFDLGSGRSVIGRLAWLSIGRDGISVNGAVDPKREWSRSNQAESSSDEPHENNGGL